MNFEIIFLFYLLLIINRFSVNLENWSKSLAATAMCFILVSDTKNATTKMGTRTDFDLYEFCASNLSQHVSQDKGSNKYEASNNCE